MSAGSEEDRKAGLYAIGLGLAVALAAGGWWWWQRSQSVPPAVVEGQMPADAAEVATVEPPAIEHPLDAPAEPAVPDAPPLDADAAALAALNEVLGSGIGDWLVNEQIARRIVATVDNLGRSASLEKVRPLRPPATPFAVERETLDAAAGTERIVIAPANTARYDSLVAMVAGTDAAAAAATYKRLYPQLQAAYEDLGYPGRYFNDRVVAVIDHLLATPELQGEVLLEQPRVLYHYADDALESRSSGQKALMRIGPGHARTVKAKLGEFRAQIAAAPPSNDNKE